MTDEIFDLSDLWAQDGKGTARKLSQTMAVAMDGTDRAPIRTIYRDTRHRDFRALVAGMMADEPNRIEEGK